MGSLLTGHMEVRYSLLYYVLLTKLLLYYRQTNWKLLVGFSLDSLFKG